MYDVSIKLNIFILISHTVPVS